mgnify:FL=1
MYFREVTEEQARARNLLISIAKGLHNEDEIGGRYMIDEIRTRFYFSQRDIKYQFDTFFDSVEEAQYVLRPNIGAYLAKVLRAHNCACSGLEAAESIFVKRFGQLRNAVRSNHYGFTPEMRKTYAEIQKLVPILHWGRLPIISKYLMINSELIPEENLTEFYDGFDMLEALLNDIYGKGESMEMNGDQTLGKELTFSVFCRRWGHTDSYRMQRTIDGWNVRHISINGACDPDGTGALLMNLQHDSIFYPEEGVKYGLQKLWEDADDGKIDVEQLQIKLQQIADWISKVEQAVGAGQPEWLNYY